PILITQHGFNTSGVSDDQTTTGNLDGYNDSYSAQALAAAGFIPGADIASAGLHFRWPSQAPGQADAYLAQGQPFGVLNAQGVRTVGFLGAATGQAAGGEGLLVFTDGTTQPFTLHLDDWTLNGGTTHLTHGNSIAATMPYHNTANGARHEATMLYVAHVTVPDGKTLRSITLPAAPTHGHLHIFAIGTDVGAASTITVGSLWSAFSAFFAAA
ncbi:MAG: hypothetical protein H0X24_16265, partial [Ktedonobacterales bacterium]|nr:hypothetical protein [Ktedonobacterales bacterium]